MGKAKSFTRFVPGFRGNASYLSERTMKLHNWFFHVKTGPRASSPGVLSSLLMVPEGRLELPQASGPADFESAASTIPPLRRRNYFVVRDNVCQPWNKKLLHVIYRRSAVAEDGKDFSQLFYFTNIYYRLKDSFISTSHATTYIRFSMALAIRSFRQ